VQLPAIWDALTSWWLEPVSDVVPSGDRRFFYLSQAPADVDAATTSVFAGRPPAAIAALDLVCLEFSRDFVRWTRPNHGVGLGGAAVALWYESTPVWESLRTTPDWIDLGLPTPNYDWATDGRDPARLIAQIEQAPVFTIASTEPALTLTMGYADEHGDGPDEVVSIASRDVRD
jgi:hypothetical protein